MTDRDNEELFNELYADALFVVMWKLKISASRQISNLLCTVYHAKKKKKLLKYITCIKCNIYIRDIQSFN